MSDFSELPTALWVEAKLKELEQNCVFYHYIQKGNYASGIVMLKLNGLEGQCRLMTQQRNFISGHLEWTDALGEELIDEARADDYIQRAKQRDPDLWIIEIEDRALKNPFED